MKDFQIFYGNIIFQDSLMFTSNEIIDIRFKFGNMCLES